jgi:hypothetical protein
VDTVPTKLLPANPWPGAEVSLCKNSLRPKFLFFSTLRKTKS